MAATDREQLTQAEGADMDFCNTGLQGKIVVKIVESKQQLMSGVTTK